MLVIKLILSLSSIGIIVGCSTLHGPLMAAADILIKRLPVRSHALSWTPRRSTIRPIVKMVKLKTRIISAHLAITPSMACSPLHLNKYRNKRRAKTLVPRPSQGLRLGHITIQ